MKLLLDENLSDRIPAQISPAFPCASHVKPLGLANEPYQVIWRLRSIPPGRRGQHSIGNRQGGALGDSAAAQLEGGGVGDSPAIETPSQPAPPSAGMPRELSIAQHRNGVGNPHPPAKDRLP